MDERRCTYCRESFPLTEEYFYPSKTKWFKGFQYACKPCGKLKSNERHKEKYQKYKARYREYWKKYNKENRHKLSAQKKARLAIKNGKIEKLPCKECGDAKVQAHHPDYDKPLEVVFLCSSHHQRLHQKLRNPAKAINHTCKPNKK